MLPLAGGSQAVVDLKVLRSRVVAAEKLQGMAAGEVGWSADGMLVPCGEGTVLEVLMVQPPMKKVVSARDFKNGLGTKRLIVQEL
jgi:methionyl-tRNA formyltransferase